MEKNVTLIKNTVCKCWIKMLPTICVTECKCMTCQRNTTSDCCTQHWCIPAIVSRWCYLFFKKWAKWKNMARIKKCRNVFAAVNLAASCDCNYNWGTCTAPPTRRPRAHHRVNPYPGARRQNETEMFSDHGETSLSIVAVSAPSVACSMLAVQQQKRLANSSTCPWHNDDEVSTRWIAQCRSTWILATDVRRSEIYSGVSRKRLCTVSYWLWLKRLIGWLSMLMKCYVHDS